MGIGEQAAAGRPFLQRAPPVGIFDDETIRVFAQCQPPGRMGTLSGLRARPPPTRVVVASALLAYLYHGFKHAARGGGVRPAMADARRATVEHRADRLPPVRNLDT